MHESFQALLGADWFPHVYVLRTRSDSPWIPAFNNLSIAAAHLGIVLMLWQVMRKRKESEFRWVALLFGMFNGIRCLTQTLGIWPFWHLSYELHWGFRAVTAVLAVGTAVALVRSLPAMHRLPSAAELEKEIEERRLAEEAALEKEERLRNFVESVQDYAMYMIDLEGVIQSWNSGAERMTGYRADEVIGQSCSRFYRAEDLIAGDAGKALQIVKETGRYEGESRLMRKDGTLFLGHVIMRPLLGPSGRLRGFSKVIRDVTETRALEAKYKILLDAMPDGIVIIDGRNRIQFANERTVSLFGYSQAELRGKDFMTLAPEHLRTLHASRHEQFFLDPGSFAFEHDTEPSGLRKDGSLFHLEVTLRPLHTPAGVVAVISMRDVSERIRTEARFQAMLEAAPDAVIVFAGMERIAYVNRRAEQLLRYDRQELIGQPPDLLIPERMRAERRAARARLIQSAEPGKTQTVELVCMRKDGSEFEAEVTASPIETAEGRSYLVFLRDTAERKRAETRFRAMLEAAPDAVLIYAPPDKIAYVNRRAEELFGYSRSDLMGQPADLVVPERVRDVRRAVRERLLKEATPMSAPTIGERVYLRQDGSEFEAEVTVSPIETADGPVLLSFLRDTTQRKRTEARFRALLESAPDAMVISGGDGMIELTNLQAERLYGYSQAEMLGQPVEMLIPPQFRADYKRDLQWLWRGEPGRKAGGGRELRALRKDGTEIPVEISFSPLEGPNGMSLIAAVRDITERRLAEEAVREREERFRSFVDGVEDYAIYMIDPQGFIETWNHGAERMKGYTAEEIVGQNFERFYTPEDRAQGRPQEALRTAAEEGFSKGEGWRVRKDGSRFLANVTMRPLRDSQGALRGFSKVTRDVTESRELETRFQVLLEAAPDTFLIVNRAGEIEFINAQGENTFGYAREEVLGKSVDMLNPERVREAQAAYRNQLFSGSGRAEGGSETDLWGLRKDGTEFPLEFTLSPLDTKDGRVFLFALRDITQRKKTEARFQALLESAPDAMVIVNSDGCIELANQQTERLFGYSRPELAGQSVDILVPLDLRAGHVAHRDRFFASPKPRQMGAGFDLEARRKDGTLFPVEISLSPLEGPDGVSVTAAIRDVTERKKAETRFRALLESAPDAMVIVNSEGCIELANLQTEKLFGFSRLELVGQSVDILVPLGLQEAHATHRAEFFRNPKKREMGANLDLMALRKDQTQFPVEISLSPLEGPDGISVTAAIRDISERRAAVRQLAEKMTELHQSNEALEQFAHIASHDLQEPLRMVASYTQLLSRRYKGRLDADADEFIDFAVDGTQRMKRLIEDLLLYSRAGNGAPPMVRFDANASLREAVGNLRAAIKENHAEVTSDPLPTLVAVESQLVQLLQNLIGNAIKYRGERNPKVHVSAGEGCREWVFSVRDNGIGIDPKYFDRIFQIFQRLHGRGEYEGTGIGLAICKRILQQQGGRIWLESEPGQGSVFHFSLPMR